MLLEGRNIHFTYGDKPIFNNFSFELKKGEKLALKGESGSGKSTLFRLILGFEKPNRGEFLYEDKRLEGETLQSFRKKTAWLPQDLNIGEGSVNNVIRFPFQFKKSNNKMPEDDKINKTLEKLGLESELLQKKFSDLSTGQRQRIGILICFLMDRPLTFLDEPTSALDHESKKKLADLLLESNRTILSTSHDPFWVERCDRIVELT